MATNAITSTGLASGFPVEAMVTKLMSVEQRPITLLQTKEASYQTKLSSWGQISNALASLQVAAEALDTRSEFAAFSASVTDSSVASITSSSSSVAGNYSLEVSQLADVQKIKSSSGYATTDSQFTTNTSGTLTLEIGATSAGVFTADDKKTKSITIDSSNNTLSGIRDAINNAKAGVTASLVNDGGTTPYRLLITSDNTGTTNSFKLSGLSDFSYDPATASGAGTTKIQEAADAKFTVDGISITKSSNTVSDAIQGTTLTLKKTNVGAATKVAIAQDNSAIEAKVSAFVAAYNTLASIVKVQTSYDTTTKVAGNLNGDSSVRSIMSQMRGILTSSVGTGSVTRLAEIGITFQKDGSLKLESSKFQAALTDTTKDVAGLFAKDKNTGVASQIGSTVKTMLATNGLVKNRTESINKSMSSIEDRISVLSDRMTAIEKRYRAQFNAMDATISKLNATSTYLTQQLAALTKSSN